MLTYSQRMDRDPKWAIHEARKIFRGESLVDQSLERITKRLDELGIPYAVAGGMAVFHHGLRRFTEDVDILVRQQDISRIHDELEGRGYLPKFRGSKNLRDTDSGVSIEFLLSGDYPGDGKPKPIAFPDPADVVELVEGVRCINLTTLIELKLASSMTNPNRAKDLGDVQELIKILRIPKSFAEKLNPFVQEVFEAQVFRRTFALLVPQDTSEAEIVKYKLAGLSMEPWKNGDLIARTTDPELAKEFDMHDESELL